MAMNDVSFQIELKYTFLAEAKEMLDETESIFMQIETNPKDLSKMDKIMRNVHTIKGSGAVVGYSVLVRFTHKFEAVLVAIREKNLSVTTQLTDLLLASNDCLMKSVTDLHTNPDMSIEHHLTKTETDLEKFLDGLKNGQAQTTPQTSEGVKSTPEILKSSQISDTKTQNNGAKESKGTVLVCDDEEDICDILKDIFEENGYSVIVSYRAAAALDILKSQRVDLIMTDLKMPGMDGIEFTKQVRASNNYIPIVFVSGNISREHVKTFLEYGVNDFVDKPFEAKKLVVVLDRAMRTRALWNELLNISKVCFKAFVAIQKVENILYAKDLTVEEQREKSLISESLSDIKSATERLLDIEKLKFH